MDMICFILLNIFLRYTHSPHHILTSVYY